MHDELEHFTRSEITSQGILIPEADNGNYKTIGSVNELYGNNNGIRWMQIYMPKFCREHNIRR